MAKLYLFAVLNAILLFAQITNISALDKYLKGRLLTPEQGCGISKALNTKIVGGTEAKQGAFPWIALIASGADNSFNCAGTLISSRHVLTSAKCVKPDIKFVRLGEHDITTDDGAHQDIKIRHAAKHPNYLSFDYTNDIGILTLEHDVEFDDHIRPVCLPLTEQVKSSSFVGSNPFIAGWGSLNENGPQSNVLMQVQLPVLENELCKEKYSQIGELLSNNQFFESTMCAGNLAGGQDACQSDAGGPLMLPILENGAFPVYQIGIVSYGVGCGRPDIPRVYTRVSYFMDFINKIVNDITY